MQAHPFFYGPKVLSGAGASARAAELLPPGRCLFVTDARVRALGLAERALAALAEAGVESVIFDAVEPDPSRATLMAAVEAGQGCTSAIGFGGGSPMDVAKLAAYLLGSGDTLDEIWGVGKATGKRLPLVLIPTTAGTGSEATQVTIITVGDTEKRGVSSEALIADWAILDAELTLGLPRDVTAATGMDAIVHAIEAYTSARLKNPISDLLAKEALRLLSGHLIHVCEQPEQLDSRAKMLLGSHLGGVAFANAPVAGVHALAYPLGGHFHVPHGVSNVLMLPHVLRHNMHSAGAYYAELAVVLDPTLAPFGAQAQAQSLVQRLSELSIQAGLPQRLRDVGVIHSDLDLLAAEAMKQERLLINNPCPITEADARRLYEAAL